MNNLDDLSGEDLGSASKVEERKIGDSDMVFVEGCPQAKSVSVLLRGGTEHVVDEVKRAFEDAIGVVAVAHEDGSVLTGGGSVIAALSRDLRSYAEGIGGGSRWQLRLSLVLSRSFLGLSRRTLD